MFVSSGDSHDQIKACAGLVAVANIWDHLKDMPSHNVLSPCLLHELKDVLGFF